MVNRRSITLITLLALLMSIPLLLSAQDDTVYADGLNNPRNVTFDNDGNLYVAEAGIAGGQSTSAGDAYGASGTITQIAPDGSSEVIINGLISYRDNNPIGATAIQVTDESYWILLAETADFRIPWTHALVELDRETGRVQTFIDLLELELNEDPDGNPNSESNAVDFAVAEDGSILIANAGCNCLMAWSADAGLSVAVSWDFETDNPVPTSVEIGPNGDIYVGFLTGFPFPQEGSRIERWSGGELAETYEGLTAVTGLLVTEDGTIYASEYGVFNQGWEPGRVVMVTSDGITPVLEDLTFPFGLAQAPDGTVVVATGSASGEGAGQVVVVPTGM